MGSAYTLLTSETPYFITPTVVGWIDVFTRPELAQIVIDSLNFIVENKGVNIHCWCLMPSHLHLIFSCKDGILPSDVVRDFKKFVAQKVLLIIPQIKESRKEWMLKLFEEFGRQHNQKFKFWQEGNLPLNLTIGDRYHNAINYIHQNPVEAGFVVMPEHFKYSSAVDYCGGKGLVPITYL